MSVKLKEIVMTPANKSEQEKTLSGLINYASA